jgi:hypothetical protein
MVMGDETEAVPDMHSLKASSPQLGFEELLDNLSKKIDM